MQVRFWIVSLLALLNGLAFAQEKDCKVVSAMAKMALATSLSQLNHERPKANYDYAVQAVFAVRQFELMPSSKDSATLLLNSIPRNEDEQSIWMNMSSSQCDEEPVSEMISLGRLADRFARDLARAAILVPARMKDYVWYAAEASSDPHSDYAIQMQRVCRVRHAAFKNAVQQLDGSGASDRFTAVDAVWFRAHILNPDTCRALTFPEAE